VETCVNFGWTNGVVAGIRTGIGFAGLKNCRTWIRI